VGKPLNLPFDPIERAAERSEETWGPASAMRVATSFMRAPQILFGEISTRRGTICDRSLPVSTVRQRR